MRMIDADTLNDYVMDIWGKGNTDNTCVWYGDVLAAINDAPTIDAVPVVHGQWEWVGEDRWNDTYECSECGRLHTDDSNYCPNCGARMNKEEQP